MRGGAVSPRDLAQRPHDPRREQGDGHLEPEGQAGRERVEPSADGRAARLADLGGGPHPAVPARVLGLPALGLERDPQQGAVGAGDEGAAAAEHDLGDHDPREARRGRVDQPARAPERGAHEERPAVADAIGDVAGGELEEDHREAEHGLEQEDVRERQPDLILQEQRDDRDREQRELQRGERDEQARVGRHEGTAPAPIAGAKWGGTSPTLGGRRRKPWEKAHSSAGFAGAILFVGGGLGGGRRGPLRSPRRLCRGAGARRRRPRSRARPGPRRCAHPRRARGS